jgi:hypothetical protein
LDAELAQQGQEAVADIVGSLKRHQHHRLSFLELSLEMDAMLEAEPYRQLGQQLVPAPADPAGSDTSSLIHLSSYNDGLFPLAES